jgi:hypothetical protein
VKHGENDAIKQLLLPKFSDGQAEATETQIWPEFAVKCHYLDAEIGRTLYHRYDQVFD